MSKVLLTLEDLRFQVGLFLEIVIDRARVPFMETIQPSAHHSHLYGAFISQATICLS